jgi:predicted GIY-YIG superfamily endonuclease
MVAGKENRTNQSVESKLARLGHRCSARQITVRDFSTSLEMTRSWLLEYYSKEAEAIVREKQLKRWSRAKKVALINRLNPSWLDLGMDVLQDR